MIIQSEVERLRTAASMVGLISKAELAGKWTAKLLLMEALEAFFRNDIKRADDYLDLAMFIIEHVEENMELNS